MGAIRSSCEQFRADIDEMRRVACCAAVFAEVVWASSTVVVAEGMLIIPSVGSSVGGVIC